MKPCCTALLLVFLSLTLFACGTGTTIPAVEDTDNDGVNETNDMCPHTAAGATVDASGCAVAAGSQDSDGDGVIDEIDSCPNTASGATVDASGCTVVTGSQDSDGDGVIDENDSCPNTVTGAMVDASGCAVAAGSQDSDGDGVIDEIDSCPNTASGATVDASGCTVVTGSQDSDGDGVIDENDSCPNTVTGAMVDASGCTVITGPPAGGNDEVTTGSGILVGGGASARPGFVVYVFDNDLTAPGSSTCINSCVATWPPVLINDGLASGVSGLGSIDRSDGGTQVTHNNRPIYFFSGDTSVGENNGVFAPGWHSVAYEDNVPAVALYNENTVLEPVASYVREDGVIVTRLGDRGRDRHAKDITSSDHYDHFLAHYWEYRTARIQLEDYVRTGESRITATFITEEKLGAREFRVWYWGLTTTGQFHFNPQKEEQKVNPLETGVVYVGQGTWNNDFEKISDTGHQHKYTLDIVNKWENGGQFQKTLEVGMNMEFEVSQFLLSPPAGSRLNYYGTSYVYVVGSPGVAPFEWQRGINNAGGSNDGTPLPAKALLGGKTTLGYNYSEEPAGRFMAMATNLSPGNAQPFVRGRRVHHTNFINGVHDERSDNPVWTEQIGKAGNHYINHSCSACHVRNGRALVADVGDNLEKWVFKVADANGDADPFTGNVLQPARTGTGESEGSVSLGSWTELANGLRSPDYVFSKTTPARFSARIAPQLVGLGLLDAVAESTIMAWADPDDEDNDGISGRAAVSIDPVTGVARLGRFGYKAATSSIRHQIAAALNTDIGVMTSLLPGPDCGSLQLDCGNNTQELSDAQFDDLVKYNSLLGVGARRNYDNTGGETIFANIGCAGCHRDTMTTSEYHPFAELRAQTIHPYTDMLLHDMGDGLADNLGEGIATGAEWRTAPLWGLGHASSVMLGDAKADDLVSLAGDINDVNRIGYLHDGRARTIDEAIRWHGGEALNAKIAYEALSQVEQTSLLDFLGSL